tara:strand:+ start:1903 stop:2037 length:135 start_codon:yes stop_codon:yes gene_type:complete
MQKITIVNYDELTEDDPLLIKAKKEVNQLLNKNNQQKKQNEITN